MPISGPQRRALREFDKWGEYSPDMEHIVGCDGAAFRSVVDALRRKGLIIDASHGGVTVTEAGRKALD